MPRSPSTTSPASEKADQDVEQVKARRVRDQDRMDKGLVTNPKDLERMQHELVSLDRRISSWRTPSSRSWSSSRTRRQTARLAERLVAIDARTSELTRRARTRPPATSPGSAQATDQRKVVADGVPDDLLALYEKVRAQKGGVGAAALRARRCGGCSLELTASDLGTIAKAPLDEVLRCKEYSRILVRTSSPASDRASRRPDRGRRRFRGNPGPAAYGAVLFDADTREVIAERAETIGVATNNVAEYRGLIAGLELFHEHAPEAELEVRMDSKLVVEQMSGRWKIKHPDMRPLAMRANERRRPGRRAPGSRGRRTAADRILNEALDRPAGNPGRSRQARPPGDGGYREVGEGRGRSRSAAGPGPAHDHLVLVRHGVTSHTVDKRFSSGLGGSNPGLTDEGVPRCGPRRTGWRRSPTGSTWWSPRR